MTEVIAEIGINHNGEMWKARRMIADAANAGCKVVKFQCHVVEDEYSHHARTVVPGNAQTSILDIMERCSFTEANERELKEYAEELGLEYLCTPFSRAAADRLERMGVKRYKIGSGECNNLPLIKHIAAFGKPIILSTGMNSMATIEQAVDACGDCHVTLMHCVSMYPTPYDRVNLPRMQALRWRFGLPAGLSDHSQGIYTALAAVALGAAVVEKHFTSDPSWEGEDIPISITPRQLRDLVRGVNAIEMAMQDSRPDDAVTKDFAFASVVTLRDIQRGETLTADNIWVKRPAGGIPAAQYEHVLGRVAATDIGKDEQVTWANLLASE